MAAKHMDLAEYNARRLREGWSRFDELADFPSFTNFVNYSRNASHQRFGETLMAQVKALYVEVEKLAGPQVPELGPITIFLEESASQKFVSLWRKAENRVTVWALSNPPARSFRRTLGIVSERGDPALEADVIMSAVTLGFAATYIESTGQAIQFDMDPLDGPIDSPKGKDFEAVVGRMDAAVVAYLIRKGKIPAHVKPGLSPGYSLGAVVMGVYGVGGKEGPRSVSAPVLSSKGKALWEKIRTLEVSQYTGRGAYTGFVDNKNTVGDTDPVGPRSTARFRASLPRNDSDPHPRWLPPRESPLWGKRKRDGHDSYVPWGLIGGDSAGEARVETGCGAMNMSDFITVAMRNDGMAFEDAIGPEDIAQYTHGMIQALYKAYHLGPNCEPYEIAVGDHTKKMASCLTCTLFMNAAGYPPTSIHLGRGESWAPLYQPYNPNGPTGEHEDGVIRDLNNAWYARCVEWLQTGLAVLDDSHIADDHRASRDAVQQYLNAWRGDPTVGGVLVLDAVTIHAGELDRLRRTLK